MAVRKPKAVETGAEPVRRRLPINRQALCHKFDDAGGGARGGAGARPGGVQPAGGCAELSRVRVADDPQRLLLQVSQLRCDERLLVAAAVPRSGGGGGAAGRQASPEGWWSVTRG